MSTRLSAFCSSELTPELICAALLTAFQPVFLFPFLIPPTRLSLQLLNPLGRYSQGSSPISLLVALISIAKQIKGGMLSFGSYFHVLGILVDQLALLLLGPLEDRNMMSMHGGRELAHFMGIEGREETWPFCFVHFRVDDSV